MADAMHSIVTKLIRRHPHVFGDGEVDGTGACWQTGARRAREKAKAIIQTHPLDGAGSRLLERHVSYNPRRRQHCSIAKHWRTKIPLAQATAVHQRETVKFLWQLVALSNEHDVNAEDALRRLVRDREEDARVEAHFIAAPPCHLLHYRSIANYNLVGLICP